MDPEHLKKQFEERNSRSVASAAEAQAVADSDKNDRERKAEQGRAALRDVVVPYFKELEASFDKENLWRRFLLGFALDPCVTIFLPHVTKIKSAKDVGVFDWDSRSEGRVGEDVVKCP